jgi:transposase
MIMRSYSPDLRERIVRAVEGGQLSLRRIAHLFAVSLSTIVRLLQRRRKTGSLLPEPHAGGPAPKLDAAAHERLRELVRQQPDATLAELRDRLGIRCSLMTVARALTRARITRKKKTRRARERDTPEVRAERVAFEDRLAAVPAGRQVFVDEMGATTAMTRAYGRAPAGERVGGAVPGSWRNVTLIAGLRQTGVIAPFAFAGAADGAAFRTYVAEVLASELEPGDVVVWDNLQPHKDAAAVAAVEAAGARVERLPPYSPDESPIEEMFSKVKECLRSAAARTVDTVIAALGSALNQVTPSDIDGWFHHRCAYAKLL